MDKFKSIISFVFLLLMVGVVLTWGTVDITTNKVTVNDTEEFWKGCDVVVDVDGFGDFTDIPSVLSENTHYCIKNGTYTTAQINYTSNITLEGSGKGATIIKLADGTNMNSSMGVIQPDGYGNSLVGDYFAENVYIAHLTVDANMAGNPTGTYEGIVLDRIRNGVMFDVEVYGAQEAGIIIGNPRKNIIEQPCTCIACHSHDNDEDGFQIRGGLVSNSHAYNQPNGFRVVSASNHVNVTTLVTSSFAFNNTNGFVTEIQGSGKGMTTEFIGCHASHNRDGFNLGVARSNVIGGTVEFSDTCGIYISANHTKVSDVTIRNNDQNETSHSPYNQHAGICILAANRHWITIKDNKIFDDQTVPTQNFSIGFYSASSNYGDENLIENNYFYLITDDVFSRAIPAGWTVRNNYGHDTNDFNGTDITNIDELAVDDINLTKTSNPRIRTLGSQQLALDPAGGYVSIWDNSDTMGLRIYHGASKNIELNSNSDSYFNTGNGVCIGGTSAEQELDVIGDVNITGVIYLGTTRPTATEGVTYYNNTAGYKCLMTYNSTDWICYTGTASP